MDNIKNFLELLGLAEVDLLLGISVSIFIGIIVNSVLELLGMSVVKETNLYAKSLLDATMQYSSIRERSIEWISCISAYCNSHILDGRYNKE